jgi:putative peptidoglycan lipid II flippase
MQLPETIIGTAFGLVAFPTLAELAARRDPDGLRRTLGESLRMVLALAVPAAAGLILLGRPLLALLYQRGEFDAAATEAVYTALRFYALGLAGHACLELAARGFFALQDTITPLLIAALSAVTNIGLGLILMQPLSYGGLALANSIAVTGEVLLLLFVLRRRINGVEGRAIAGSLLRTLAATGIMSAAILVTSNVATRAGLGGLFTLAACGAAGGVAYLLAAWVLRIDTLFGFIRALGIQVPLPRAAEPHPPAPLS